MRVLFASLLILLLAGCYGDLDPCTFDRTVPACDLSRSKAQATISAIDSAVAAEHAKATISIKATQQVVKAAATQDALRADATRQSISADATSSAIMQQATRSYVDGEATKIAVSVSGAVERANVERAAVPYNSIFNVIVFWFLIPALLVLAVIIYGKRTVHRATDAFTQSLHKRAAMITYGPPNNPQLAFVTFDRVNGQPIRFITSEGMIGPTANLLTGATALDDLDLPAPLKVAALLESSKRSQAARIATATGIAPWNVTRSVVDNQAQLAVPEPIAPATVQLPRIPTFAELLQTWQPTPDRIIFGLDDAIQPLYGRLDQLLSVIIVGRQGTGKTNLLRFIYAQCLLVGADVMAWDIHEDIINDLPGARIFTSKQAIDRSAGEAIVELDRRIGAGEKRSARPLMVLIDEMNSLVYAVPEIIEAVRRIVTEGRKYNVYCVVSCKGAPADEFGKSYIRDAFSAHYAFNTTTRQAIQIGFDREDVEPVRRLECGQALLEGPVTLHIVRIPLIQPEEIKSLLPTSPGKNEPLRPTSATSGEVAFSEVLRQSEAAPEAADPFDEVEPEVDPLHARIVEMLRAGASRNAIIREVYHVTGGEKYQRASAEINQIQKELLNV